MIDKYTTLSDIMCENPIAADILMSYGIPTYAITENQFSTYQMLLQSMEWILIQ